MQLTDPTSFDAFLHNSTVDRFALLDEMPDCPLRHIRRLQVQMAIGDFTALRAQLNDLPDIPPMRGVRVLAFGELGELSVAEHVDLTPRGIAPLELEESCLQHVAAGVSAAQRGDFEAAHAYNQTALYLASALGMHNRAQALHIEVARVSALKGKPTPEALQTHLLNPMPLRRRQWGQRTLAESLMGLGSYSDALRALASPTQDSPTDAALREFLHAVLGLPEARLPGDELLCPDAPYVLLATALRQAQSGDVRVKLPEIRGEPQAIYAAMIEASALARTPRFAQQGVGILESLTPLAPDQRFYLAAILFGAAARGLKVRNVHQLCDTMREACHEIRHVGECLHLMRQISPEVLVLLALGPAHGSLPAKHLNINQIPLLAGKKILYGNDEHDVPGRSGRFYVREAMGVIDDELERVEHRRYATKLRDLHLPRPVNLGGVVVAAGRLADQARSVGLPSLAAGWRGTQRRVMKLMTQDVYPGLPDHLQALLSED